MKTSIFSSRPLLVVASILGAQAILLDAATNMVAAARDFTFVVTADSRSRSLSDENGLDSQNDQTGVNIATLQAVIDKAKASSPDFLIFAGDMVYGKPSANNDPSVKAQLQRWISIVDNNGAGFSIEQIMPVWGGHEKSSTIEAWTDNKNDIYSAWKDIFDPVNTFSPEGLTTTCHYPDPELYGDFGNTVYYCDVENTRFFVLNNDVICDDSTDKGSCEAHVLEEHENGEHYRLRQLEWIRNHLLTAGKQINFFIHHEPAYGSCAHSVDFSGDPKIDYDGETLVDADTMDAKPYWRNAYVELITPYTTLMFSAHEHQYTRRLISSNLPVRVDGNGDTNNDIYGSFYEIKPGSSGAPIYNLFRDSDPDCMTDVELEDAYTPNKDTTGTGYYTVVKIDNTSGSAPSSPPPHTASISTMMER
jgi:hypothetical protein